MARDDHKGGTAAIAAPAMGPIMDTVVSTIGDSIAVEMGMRVGYDVGIKVRTPHHFSSPLSVLTRITHGSSVDR